MSERRPENRLVPPLRSVRVFVRAGETKHRRLISFRVQPDYSLDREALDKGYARDGDSYIRQVALGDLYDAQTALLKWFEELGWEPEFV